MKKAFETFKMQGVRYLAFPNGNNFHIADENGNNFGSWMTVKNFKKAIKLEPLGKVEIFFRVCRDSNTKGNLP